MTARHGAHDMCWKRRALVWALLGTALAAASGWAPSQVVVAGPVRPAAVTTRALSADEQHLLSLMDPDDRARYLLQERISETAQTAALLAQIQAKRHEAALSIINSMR